MNSFVPGTPVLLVDGSRKPIEYLEIGDRVVATDPATARTSAESIVGTIVGQGSKDLVDITIGTMGPDGSVQSKVVRATAGHPFYLPEVGRWIDAGRLASGDRLASLGGDYLVVVTGIKRYTAPAKVYNLTVGNLHTYYVLAGSVPILVHNSGPDCRTPIGGKSGDGLGEQDFHGSDYSLDEVVEFANGHTDDGNPVLGRPGRREIESTLRNAGPVQLRGQNSSRFDHKNVRVIVNWDMPWRTTTYYRGGS